MRWTDEQKNAIELPVSDMIVSAAAGSGKTAVMAERILTRLTCDDYVDIDKILVVTYTSAAASEIKERIMKRILSELEEAPSKVLSEQLIKLPYAHISTIHSFCLDLIRKYFYLLDIDPGVKIADETEVQLMKDTVASDLMSSYYDADDKVFLDLIASYTKRHDSAIGDTIVDIYNFSRTMANPDEWLDALVKGYTDDNQAELSFLMNCAKSAGKLAVARYKEAIDLCGDDEECIVLKNFLLREYEVLLSAMEAESYSDMKNRLDAIEFTDWRGAKGPEDIRNIAKDKRSAGKKIITDTMLAKYFLYSEEEIHNDNDNVKPFILKLTEMAKAFADKYDALKREKNLIDFSDFEHLALKILRNPDGTPSDVAVSVAEGFEEIYIDEFQDCNNIQDTIFRYISGGIIGKPNVFCVGDMKQSIYRFRDSNPLIFRDKCEAYPLYDGTTVHQSNKILLTSNFRSRKSVLDFVNSLFSQIMSKQCGELDYTEAEQLNYGGGFEDINPDVDFIDIDLIDSSNTLGISYSPDDDLSLTDIEAEAIHVAQKIKKYISEGYMLHDKKTDVKKPATYSDIVILLRSAKTVAPIFEKALSDAGIPVYSDKGTPYFDTEEIVFLINLLKIIDNPDDDIALVSVMKNPVFGFDENQLLKIRLEFRDKSFYASLNRYIESFDNELSKRASEFVSSIEKFYARSKYMDTVDFLCYIIKEINFYAYLSLFPDAKLKKTNVRYLLRKAVDFEKNNYKGIYSFVRYAEGFKEENKVESAKVISESDNVVRIMSIHKSKGLEFPIVFVSGLGRKFNNMDATKSFVMHKECGIGADSVYREKAVRYNTLNKLVIKRKITMETISEELRVLYVALTRATEKLVLTACMSRLSLTLSQVEETAFAEGDRINPHLILSSDCFMKMILYAVVRSEGFPHDFTYKSPLIADGCKFNLTLKNISEIDEPDKASDRVDWLKLYDGPTNDYQRLCDVLSFEYPYSDTFSLPSNLTVTELKKMAIENEGVYNPFEDTSLAEPTMFNKNKALSGASFGTVLHYVMEKINFNKLTSENEIAEELERLHEAGMIDDSEFVCIDTKKIYAFACSEIGKRMIERSDFLCKEFSFKYLADAKSIFETSSDEKIVVQGTIDAYFEDEDSTLVIVDYKTDKIIDGDVGVIAERYHSQLDYYAKALETITGKKVKEKILYLFDCDKTIEV